MEFFGVSLDVGARLTDWLSQRRKGAENGGDMGDGTARRFWQIHLLTAVVLMIQVGLLIPIFIAVYDSDGTSRLVMDVGLYGLAIVCLSIVIVEYTVRAESEKMIQVSVGVALIALGGLIGRTIATPIRIESNHSRAMHTCMQFATAEEIWHRTDYGDPLCYAQTLRELFDSDKRHGNEPFIDSRLACAEYSPGRAVPKDGYVFRVLTAQGTHSVGGKRSYLVDHHSGFSPPDPRATPRYDMTISYALIAFPSDYAVTGRMTFIINGNGTIYEKDLGPNTTKLGAAMTEFDPDPSWTPVDGR